ncbi:MAG TPA: CRISPR-associated endonuclease Cas2 [Desulfohalobiaceae bacterium]|nr:CRISPR-associated endonuclease Cas2 [Desulfohalobiaceae bacterium]
MRQVYIVSYDICEDKRLRRVYKLMRGFGDHLQYSVFQCELSKMELVELKSRLSEIINQSDDQVLFIPLGPPDGQHVRGITSLGLPYCRTDNSCFVV